MRNVSGGPARGSISGNLAMQITQPDTTEQKLTRQIEAYQGTALVYTAVRLGLPELLESGSRTISELAAELECDADNLDRLLTALESIELIEKNRAGLVSLSSAGRLLLENSPSPCRELAIIAVEQHWPSWSRLDYCVRTGKPAFEYLMGEGPFSWRSKNPAASYTFNRWLKKETGRYTPSILAKIEVTGCRRVVDVGGGNGSLLAGLLNMHHTLQGVLFDQPHVVAQARDDLRHEQCYERIEFVNGDFFQAVPVIADLYILKSVLHDWTDDEALRILKACHASMHDNARLVIVERLIGQSDDNHQTATMVDLAMMAVTGGRERRQTQFELLLGAAGFQLKRIEPCATGFYLIEGRRR